jgi:hypothetical protein
LKRQCDVDRVEALIGRIHGDEKYYQQSATDLLKLLNLQLLPESAFQVS